MAHEELLAVIADRIAELQHAREALTTFVEQPAYEPPTVTEVPKPKATRGRPRKNKTKTNGTWKPTIGEEVQQTIVAAAADGITANQFAAAQDRSKAWADTMLNAGVEAGFLTKTPGRGRRPAVFHTAGGNGSSTVEEVQDVRASLPA